MLDEKLISIDNFSRWCINDKYLDNSTFVPLEYQWYICVKQLIEQIQYRSFLQVDLRLFAASDAHRYFPIAFISTDEHWRCLKQLFNLYYHNTLIASILLIRWWRTGWVTLINFSYQAFAWLIFRNNKGPRGNISSCKAINVLATWN